MENKHKPLEERLEKSDAFSKKVEEILDDLSPLQRSWTETLHHIFWGARRSGRTYAICSMAVCEAILAPEQWVAVVGHDNNPISWNEASEILQNIIDKHGLHGKVHVYLRNHWIYVKSEWYGNE